MSLVLVGDPQATRGRALKTALRKINITSLLVTTDDELMRCFPNPEVTLAVLDHRFAQAMRAIPPPLQPEPHKTQIVFWHFEEVAATTALADTLDALVIPRPPSLVEQIHLVQVLHSKRWGDGTDAILDLAVVRELRACCPMPGDFRHLIDNFQRDALTLLAAIRAHCMARKVELLRYSLHQLRGGAASIGGRGLLHLLDALEKQTDEPLLRHDFKDADDALAICIAALRSFAI